MAIKEKLKKLRENITRIYISMKSTETPWYAKAIGWITLVYALSPVDLIPDFIPILGYLDDLVILPVLAYITIKLIPKKVWENSLEQSKTLWENGKPKKWYYAIPFVLIWLFILYLIIYNVFF